MLFEHHVNCYKDIPDLIIFINPIFGSKFRTMQSGESKTGSLCLMVEEGSAKQACFCLSFDTFQRGGGLIE